MHEKMHLFFPQSCCHLIGQGLVYFMLEDQSVIDNDREGLEPHSKLHGHMCQLVSGTIWEVGNEPAL